MINSARGGLHVAQFLPCMLARLPLRVARLVCLALRCCAVGLRGSTFCTLCVTSFGLAGLRVWVPWHGVPACLALWVRLRRHALWCAAAQWPRLWVCLALVPVVQWLQFWVRFGCGMLLHNGCRFALQCLGMYACWKTCIYIAPCVQQWLQFWTQKKPFLVGRACVPCGVVVCLLCLGRLGFLHCQPCTVQQQAEGVGL